jgi:hypothetical protein
MITGSTELYRQSPVQATVMMSDCITFAMHRFNPFYSATVEVGQKLVPQTDPEYRNSAGASRHQLCSVTGLTGTTGTGRYYQV